MTKAVISSDAINRFRNAASQFARNATAHASKLLALKDDIAALRKRGVSYRAISELLTQSGIAASNTCVMRFCHRVLEEKPRRKPTVARHAAPTIKSAAPKSASRTATAATGNASSVPPETTPFKTRGPHIAKVELINPDK